MSAAHRQRPLRCWCRVSLIILSSTRGDGRIMTLETKRILIGRPLRTVSLGRQLLPQALALAVFCSDPISSVADATQEILVVLTLRAHRAPRRRAGDTIRTVRGAGYRLDPDG
jgi:hypothetical protein